MPMLNEASARFYSEVLGLEPAKKLGHFAVLPVSPDTTLDFIDSDAGFDRQHYAFLVTETEFDEIFGRVRGRYLAYPLVAPTIEPSEGSEYPQNIH